MQTLVAVSLELKQDGDSICHESLCSSQMYRQVQQLLFIATRSWPQLQGTRGYVLGWRVVILFTVTLLCWCCINEPGTL